MSPFAAEVIGTMLIVILSDGVVASVALTRAKGQNAGWIVGGLAGAWLHAAIVRS